MKLLQQQNAIKSSQVGSHIRLFKTVNISQINYVFNITVLLWLDTHALRNT